MAETFPALQIDGGGFAVVAPATTPPTPLLTLNRSISQTLREPEFQKQLLALGQVTANGAPPEMVGEYLKSERERWGELFRELGIKPQ
jgi:tripartite-type tricarboxylate transporter receptor subunit TctC